MRAIQVRTVRYDSRTFRRNHCVMTTISGSTENATSASRQSIQISTPMMPTSVNRSPNTDTTPDVNSSFSTSTSVVTRVISRPDRVAVVEPQVEPLQVAEHLHPQVEHDPLPDHLHRPGLQVLERERAGQREQEHGRRSNPRPDRSPAGM